jgi:CRP-like cAMP-binding protein
MKAATVAFIPLENLRELAADFPSIGALLWRSTLVEAAISREWETNLGRRPAFERMAHLFCELYLRLQAVGLADDYRCQMPITQTDLADALGLTSVHVNRVLKELRAQTLITLRNSTLVIQAWDELRQAAEFNPTYLHLDKRAA